jgi:hypothetical protein
VIPAARLIRCRCGIEVVDSVRRRLVNLDRALVA